MTAATSLFDDDLFARAERLVHLYLGLGRKLATAESCTGGLIAALLTEVPGSSGALDRGFVTYSNLAKQECLGVADALLAAHGAVSEPAARAMAEGALRASHVDVAVAVTGIAGPGGGSATKPVGLVFLACASRGGDTRVRELRLGDVGRSVVRRASALAAFDMLEEVAR
jgi:nicotinamide-nucleotide amidase